jgi:hypothetical protein
VSVRSVTDDEFVTNEMRGWRRLHGDGRPLTFADSPLVLLVRPPVRGVEIDASDAQARAGQAGRALEHEGLHVAIRRRGEQLSDIRERHSDPASAFGITLEIAGATCEEFRVERALWGVYPDPDEDSHLGDFENTLRRFDGVVRQASGEYQSDLDVEHHHENRRACLQLACDVDRLCRPEYDATGQTRLPQVNVELGRRLLGSPWVELMGELMRLPAGDIESERGDLDARTYVAAKHIEAWFAHVGFAWTDVDGGIYFTSSRQRSGPRSAPL